MPFLVKLWLVMVKQKKKRHDKEFKLQQHKSIECKKGTINRCHYKMIFLIYYK